MCVSTLKSILCYRTEEENTRYQGFKDLDVTGVQMVPHQIRNSMDSGAQCIIVQRQAPPPCDKVNQEQSDKFHEIGVDNTIHLLEEKQLQWRIPHIVLEVVVET